MNGCDKFYQKFPDTTFSKLMMINRDSIIQNQCWTNKTEQEMGAMIKESAERHSFCPQSTHSTIKEKTCKSFQTYPNMCFDEQF